MPELHSGLTGEFRAYHASKQVNLGRSLEELIALAVPDVLHVWVLARLVGAGKEGCSVSQVAVGADAPRSAVTAALERFEKLGLARSRRRLMSRSYVFAREGARADLAIRMVKLWKHPQAHGSVLNRIMQSGGGAARGPGK